MGRIQIFTLACMAGIASFAATARGAGRYNENMGPANNGGLCDFLNVTIPQAAACGLFQGAAGNYSSSGTGVTSEINTFSTGYTLASGLRNVLITKNFPTGRSFTISNINTSSYSSANLRLAFGLKSNSTLDTGAGLSVEVSTDGSTFSALTFPAAGSTNWTYIGPNTAGTIPATANLRIRFTNLSAAADFRVDDIRLYELPRVTAVTATTDQQLELDFSLAMGTGVTTTTNYTVSGTGKGTLANNPNSITTVSATKYRLNWTGTQEMRQIGGDQVTVTATGIVDSEGDPLGSPNAATGSSLGTPPTITPGLPSPTVTNSGPVNYTITYADNHALNAITLAAGNVSLNLGGTANGVVGAVTGVALGPRTVPINTITGSGTINIAIAAGTASDAAGNLAPALNPTTDFTVDNTPPTINIGPPSTTLTNAGPVDYVITYGGASSVTLTTGNVSITPTGSATGSVASVSDLGGGQWRVRLNTLAGDGTLLINVAAGTAGDAAGNLAPAAGPSASFTVDTTPPSVSIGAPSPSATISGPVDYLVSYSDLNGMGSISLAQSDVGLQTVSGTAAVGLKSVSGLGNSRTVSLSSITGNGVMRIVSIAAGTATDAAGNSAPAAGPSQSFSVDNVPPSVSSVTAETDRTILVNFTDVMGAGVTNPGNYTVTGAGKGSLAGQPDSVALDAGTVYRLTWNSPQEMFQGGAVTVTVAGTLQDLAGNTITAPLSGATTGIGTPPTIGISAPSSASTTTGPVDYTVFYTDLGVLDAVTLVPANITLNRTGSADGTISVTGPALGPKTVTISSITGNGTLGISIVSGTASDAAGNTAPAAGPSATFSVSNPTPTATPSPTATPTTTGTPAGTPSPTPSPSPSAGPNAAGAWEIYD